MDILVDERQSSEIEENNCRLTLKYAKQLQKR